MSNIAPPPSTTEVVDAKGKGTLPWIQFFENQYLGDTGTIFTPVFTNLTEVGAATKSGVYFRLSQSLYYFVVTITPATNTSSTAGTTYFDFPLDITRDGANLTVAGSGLLGGGINVASNNRIYPASWTTIANPVTIVGLVEAL